MTQSEKYLNKLVVCKTAQGDINFIGHCIMYCDAPTVGVNLPDGSQGHWRADLTEVIELPQGVLQMLVAQFGKDGK